jgi:hypothetical protein
LGGLPAFTVGIDLSSVGVSSGSLGIPTYSLSIPTYAWRVVSRSEELATYLLRLPRDGTARSRLCRGVVNTRESTPWSAR